MTTAQSESWEPRATCARCLRPERLCYCAHLPTLATRTRVVILQHPRERRVAIGTARMASLCVPGAELHVGAHWDHASLARILGDPPEGAALLYPGAGATDVSELSDDTRPRTLVLVDGTWSHTKNVLRDCPALAALPRLCFVPRAPSEYRIRREPRLDYVSTIEALAHVLGALENAPARFTAMLDPFRAMVDAQLEHAARIHTPRSRRGSRPARPRPRPPALFRERWDDLVCVSTEASAFPHGTPERAREKHGELVHLVGVRVADGTRLDHVLAPRGPLAPGTATHSELDVATIEAGSGKDAFVAAWRGLVRESDLVLYWGTHTARMLVGAGVWRADAVDMRRVLRMLESRRTGTIETFVAQHGFAASAALGRGRAGRRVAAMRQVAHYLRDLV